MFDFCFHDCKVRGELAVVLSEADPDALSDRMTIVTDEDNGSSSQPVHLLNPDIVKAKADLDEAEKNLQIALDKVAPDDETEAAGRDRRKKIGILRGEVTRRKKLYKSLSGSASDV